MATFEEVTLGRGLDDAEVWGGKWEVGKLPDRGNSRCKGPKEETHLQPKNIQVAGVVSKGEN